MLNKLNKSNKGFTIIEVMIVLAIAGLIILIVLLAVPALQRNGRNTALKNDASALVGGITEFTSNNDGKVPDPAGITGTGSITISNSTLASPAKATSKTQSSTTVTPSAGPPGVPLSVGTVYVVPKFKCNNGSNYTGAVDVIANNRSVVVIYPVEQASGPPIGRCIDS